MPFRTAIARKISQRRAEAGFTLAEVLAALAFMAIVIPVAVDGLRIASAEIAGHSGAALGTIFTGFDPLKPPAAGEANVLSVGTRLAALAIETRRLYSDLKHRSEFDLLTEIHNRFSLERYLDEQIESRSSDRARSRS